MERWWTLVIGILGLFWPACCQKYDNHTLIRIFPVHEAHLNVVHVFKDPLDQMEVFKRSRGYNDSLDVLVPPERMDFINEFIQQHGIPYEVKQRNYGKSLDMPYRTPRRRVLRNLVYEYNSYDDIQRYIEGVADSYPEIVTLQHLGQSYEGRPMVLVKISSNKRAEHPIIFIDGGVHAREWVAPAMALYIIHRLTTDPEARRRELNGVDWYILPVANPDGYEYTRSSDENRMWRKTRSKYVDNCYGVDANRNYGFKWAVSGVSTNPCDKETYAGPRAFSEPETKIVKKIMLENAKRMKLYVSLHSYGQYLVYPWGYTGEFMPKSWKKLDRLARSVSDAVKAAGGLPFHVMSAGQWYPAAGGSDDYAFGAAGVPYSYTMELTDGYEFSFPESQLRKTLPQLYYGFIAFANQIRREFPTRSNNRPRFKELHD